MTYEKFIQEIPFLLTTYFSEDTTLKVQPILKNNNLLLDGLLITTPSVNISPTIYLNPYYELYRDGCSMTDICQQIVQCYEESKPETNIDISFFQDFSRVKENIICKLISVDLNQKLLEQVPYIPFLDLAVVFCYLIPDESTSASSDTVNATILIHHNHLELWNITPQDLFAYALENTPRMLPTRLIPMTDLLLELAEPVTDVDFTPPIYVITNQLKFLGASVLLYQHVLNHCCELFEDDFYVIPSSIHEVIIVPKPLIDSTENLNRLIQEVNREHVAPEEILSDHCYYYNRSTKKLQSAFPK